MNAYIIFPMCELKHVFLFCFAVPQNSQDCCGLSFRMDFHWATFLQPPKVGYGAWVEKFVLNLCHLCPKVPEFVLLPTLRGKFRGFFLRGGGAEERLAPQSEVGAWA